MAKTENGTTVLMLLIEGDAKEPEHGFESMELKISSEGNKYWIHEIREFWFASEGKQVQATQLVFEGKRSLHP